MQEGEESSSHVEKRVVQWTISMYIPLVLRLHVKDFEVKRVTVTKQVSLFPISVLIKEAWNLIEHKFCQFDSIYILSICGVSHYRGICDVFNY
jgi:hypothetical protein